MAFYWGTGRQSTIQNVTTSGTSAASSAFGAQTYKVRLCATTDTWVLFGGSTVTVTSTTGTLLPGGVVEYFTVTPGQYVAALQVAAAGSLNITEIT